MSKALYLALNAKEIDFGQKIDYSDIYNTIVNADDRIKFILLDDVVYTAYAGYFNDNILHEALISDGDTADQTSIDFRKEIAAKCVLAFEISGFKRVQKKDILTKYLQKG